jgi:hypothetical protein
MQQAEARTHLVLPRHRLALRPSAEIELTRAAAPIAACGPAAKTGGRPVWRRRPGVGRVFDERDYSASANLTCVEYTCERFIVALWADKKGRNIDPFSNRTVDFQG